MAGRMYTLGASRNPLVQVISLIVVGLALIVAVFMGAVILAVVFGLAMIGAIGIALRIWWMRRKLERAQRRGQGGAGALIEADYEVLSERDPDRQNRPGSPD